MPTLSAQQVACYAMRAGFAGTNAARMVVIAKLESGFRTDARNPIQVCTGKECGHAVGLWQVVDFPSRVAKYGDLTDPATNARAAWDIYQSQGVLAWSVWTSGVAIAFQLALATGSIFGLNIPSLPTRLADCNASTVNPSLPTTIPGLGDVGSAITGAERSLSNTLTSYAAALLGGLTVALGVAATFITLNPNAVPAAQRSVGGLAKAALMLVK